MSKIILKRVVSGFMILLMVAGIFVAVSNFTATSAYAKVIIIDDLYYCPVAQDCLITHKGDCTLVIFY